jgi:hypothetical protein
VHQVISLNLRLLGSFNVISGNAELPGVIFKLQHGERAQLLHALQPEYSFSQKPPQLTLFPIEMLWCGIHSLLREAACCHCDLCFLPQLYYCQACFRLR